MMFRPASIWCVSLSSIPLRGSESTPDRRSQATCSDMLRMKTHLLLLARLVVLEPLLDRLQLGLNLAHRRHRLELLLRDREQDPAHDQRQADNRDAKIPERVEQEDQKVEDRPHE